MLIIIIKTVIKILKEIIVNMTMAINRHMDSWTVGYTDRQTNVQADR